MSKEIDLRQLDAQIDTLLFGHQTFKEKGDYWRSSLKANPMEWEVPRYSSDISAAMLAEDRIKELGLQCEYAVELGKLLGENATAFDYAHASAEVRCRAALKVSGEGEDR